VQNVRQKQPRVRLDRQEYEILGNLVFERDGWRCQSCGTSNNLQAHHITKRSRLGNDSLDNSITLCFNCHAQVHHRSGCGAGDDDDIDRISEAGSG
jgi:5-methylcytosine-specific restriction endonuclease McrA